MQCVWTVFGWTAWGCNDWITNRPLLIHALTLHPILLSNGEEFTLILLLREYHLNITWLLCEQICLLLLNVFTYYYYYSFTELNYILMVIIKLIYIIEHSHPSFKRLKSIRTRTVGFCSSTYPEAVHALNSQFIMCCFYFLYKTL